MKPRRAKTFTGCWTCRSRKVKCDLRRPNCSRCERSELQCGGYDIKLRWSKLVKFDPFGVQLPPSPNPTITTSTTTAAGINNDSNNNNNNNTNTNTNTNTDGAGNNNDEPQYQRRNIDFVRYKEEYVFHEDMDDELSTLHAPPPDKIANNKTWIIKKFGVFKGMDQVIDKKLSPRKKRRKINPIAAATSASKNSENASSKSVVVSKINKLNPIPSSSVVSTARSTSTKTPTELIKIKNKPEKIMVSKSENKRQNRNNDRNSSGPNLLDFDSAMSNYPGYEWISNELRDDALLSAFAIQGTSVPAFKSQDLPINNGTNATSATTSPASRLLSVQQNSILPSTTVSSKQIDINGSDIQNTLSLLFHNVNSTIPNMNQEESGDISTEFNISNSNVNSPDTHLGLDNICVDAPHVTALESKMPSVILEKIDTKPPTIDFNSLIETSRSLNLQTTIPTKGLLVHPLTRFLLNYYLDNVADLMTVVPLARNPWKTIYFPRALQALGDLTGLGRTTNSRNSLINALLAVSCFNLQSKFNKNTKEQTFFLTLGIEFRKQASNFLKQCLQSTESNEKYKDVLTAILSMNSIDVVWGTMADCQYHLTICEEFVAKRMKVRPKISEKARILHRIFSFLKLIQDSTALDKVKEKEIVIKTDTKRARPQQMTNNTRNDENQTIDSDGVFRESLNMANGKIQIEFVKEQSDIENDSTDATTPSNGNNSTPPMFGNIISDSYYEKNNTNNTTSSNSSIDLKSDILGTDTIYGLPNSLILLFSDCVQIVRHNEYYNIQYLAVPREFTEISANFEKRLLKWKPEWNFFKNNDKKIFINDNVEAVYHHTMSFYFGLIIYYYSMAKNLNNQFLQSYVAKVLNHLEKLTDLIDSKKVEIVPLIWQGFIAGCASIEQEVQQGYRKWAANLAKSGMGSYWGARQVMFEVWRRRMNEEQNDNWYSIYKDWEMNLMLS
ncbi:Arg81p NDAI_0K00150 [Naumovozyma dairenensis CBS 421]|uniref:Zn(2)-C6 fungal-type domain-containing protein n=1 Tax=Naumovozyma dairenensis (strain ATCC 10597 / BCRC 20456 / CBS 421 / NBRC 0211 / NRRL Y-12639) TaxID=1071378 RepID=G0WHE3_NAUDC|nr:hypothetical protein NDAI_0K00150 [Naumovozyma dairenensis CBS 421]CCD27204.1 hypothetical protein NDAI_0K00150 [Naumovozyma dairenensis CBS 421]